jgi:hypothetical protein
MRGLFKILSIFITTISISYGATRAEVNVLEATENIRYLSQKITTNYLYFYANPKKINVFNHIKRDISRMVESIRTISMTTNDEYTKNVLEFLTYSKDQIEDLIEKSPTKERSALMLDYSETLLEGANSIAKGYTYDFTESEKMLMVGKSIEYLLERALKYYMALSIGLVSDVNKKQMSLSMKELVKKIRFIRNYQKYPSNLIKYRDKLVKNWKIMQNILKKREKLTLTNIAVLSTNEIESLIGKFIIYHRKNQ